MDVVVSYPQKTVANLVFALVCLAISLTIVFSLQLPVNVTTKVFASKYLSDTWLQLAAVIALIAPAAWGLWALMHWGERKVFSSQDMLAEDTQGRINGRSLSKNDSSGSDGRYGRGTQGTTDIVRQRYFSALDANSATLQRSMRLLEDDARNRGVTSPGASSTFASPYRLRALDSDEVVDAHGLATLVNQSRDYGKQDGNGNDSSLWSNQNDTSLDSRRSPYLLTQSGYRNSPYVTSQSYTPSKGSMLGSPLKNTSHNTSGGFLMNQSGSLHSPRYVSSYDRGKSSKTRSKDVDPVDKLTENESQEAAMALLSKLKLDAQEDLDRWAQNMRRWLAATVFQYVSSEFLKNDDDIDLACQQLLTQLNLRPDERALLTNGKRGQRLQYLMHNFPQSPLILRRKELDEYTHVSGADHKGKERDVQVANVRERIHTLAKGSFLKEFTHDTKKKKMTGKNDDTHERNKNGQPRRYTVTDSDLVRHCFFTFLQERIVGEDFQRYQRDASNENQHGPFLSPCLAQTRALRNPAYYCVEVYEKPPQGSVTSSKKKPQKKQEWRAFPGRLNVFFALVLWLFYIKKMKNGRLGALHLSDHSLNDLLAVLT